MGKSSNQSGAAETAQVKWAELPVQERSNHLMRLADAFAAHADELLMLEVADSGNAITAMKPDLANCIERLRYYAGLGFELQGRTIPGASDRMHMTLREPFVQVTSESYEMGIALKRRSVQL